MKNTNRPLTARDALGVALEARRIRAEALVAKLPANLFDDIRKAAGQGKSILTGIRAPLRPAEGRLCARDYAQALTHLGFRVDPRSTPDDPETASLIISWEDKEKEVSDA